MSLFSESVDCKWITTYCIRKGCLTWNGYLVHLILLLMENYSLIPTSECLSQSSLRTSLFHMAFYSVDILLRRNWVIMQGIEWLWIHNTPQSRFCWNAWSWNLSNWWVKKICNTKPHIKPNVFFLAKFNAENWMYKVNSNKMAAV